MGNGEDYLMGTKLTKEQLAKLKKLIGAEVTAVVGGYEWEDDDWNATTSRNSEFVLDGIVGYRTSEGYVVTHLAGHNGHPLVYCMTAWHEYLMSLKNKAGADVLGNDQGWFYYKTIGRTPHPDIADQLGANYHEEMVDITPEHIKGSLDATVLKVINQRKKRDLNGAEITVLASSPLLSLVRGFLRVIIRTAKHQQVSI